MKDLFYNGKSLNEMGFSIKTPPVRTVAERDISFSSITGRSGDIIVDNKRYKNVDMPPYEINSIPYLVTAYDTESLARELIDWLAPNDDNYKILRDDYNPGYFCYAVCTSIGEISSKLNKHIDTSITFNRQPFWYSDLGQETTISTSTEFEIYNPEIYSSEPYIKINGSGTVYLTVNGTQYRSENIEDYIEFDTEQQSVFKDTQNCSQLVNFDYLPIFKPGTNHIKIGGHNGGIFSSIEIIPKWRRL